jgi:hypothetical protein
MNETSDIPYLQELRTELVRAAGRSNRRRRRTLVAARGVVLLAVVAAAALVGVNVFGAGGAGTDTANAAILHRMAAALAPPSGTILHEQAQISLPGEAAHPFELWVEADSPYSYRVIKWGHEGSWNGSSFSNYDAAANTITMDIASQSAAGLSHEPVDPAATLRSLVQSGQATIDGTTVVDGIPAYKLTVSGGPDKWLDGTAYVARSDYHPLEIDTTAYSEKIVYQTYQYLPATSDNLKLLDLQAQHPAARVIDASAAGTTTTSG